MRVKNTHLWPIPFKQHGEVFSYHFYDPVVYYMEAFISSSYVSFSCKYKFQVYNDMLIDAPIFIFLNIFKEFKY
jgi:hypothetical protein